MKRYPAPRWAKRLYKLKDVQRVMARPVPLKQAAIILLTSDTVKNDFFGHQDIRHRLIGRILNGKLPEDTMRDIVRAYHGTKVQDELWHIDRLSPESKQATMKVFEQWMADFDKPLEELSWEQKKELRKKIKTVRKK
jgi:hypothetical protein